jgi:uncharacterized protein (TIGR03790 family)
LSLRILLLRGLVACLLLPAIAAAASSAINPRNLAVIANTADPLSVAIANYYVRVWHVPKSNLVRVKFDSHRDEIPPAEFEALSTSVKRNTNVHIQAYALTWARPYRVGCMSITSAFAFGFQEKFCSRGCALTARNPYFDAAASKVPYDDFGMRITMSIAAVDFDHAKALIDRGVKASAQPPPGGTAYLAQTPDAERNVRSKEYPLAERIAAHEFGFHVAPAQPGDQPRDVMFYFTGTARVDKLDAFGFLPGAIADHLTSFGGMLTNSSQMSSLRWLEAGATGSYGTVVEPCNFLTKFPDVPVLLAHYLAGDTLIEAYWKSVAMPGQGIFIGDPLATPFHP